MARDAGAETIPPEEVAFHSLSFGDPSGRLFWWRGRLFRAIAAQHAPFFHQLLGTGVFQDLVRKGLVVPTSETSLSLSGYDLVLEHEVVPFVSYAAEWCGAMLRDAALAVLDLEQELLESGLTLQDAHPWNLLFRGAYPQYVDVGSIVPAD